MRKEYEYFDGSSGHSEEVTEFYGICTNCKHRATCTFAGCADRPKMFCEEFECEGAACAEPKKGIGIAYAGRSEVEIEPVYTESNSSQYMGLCVNCDNREYCKHPKPAGGVWYCEEYR
jgi:hypothetical protein